MRDRVTFEIDHMVTERDGEVRWQGWYIHGQHRGGPGFTIGPSRFEDGCATLDDALLLAREWCDEHGFEFHMPTVMVMVTKEDET